MDRIISITTMQAKSFELRSTGETLGFVPTMGYLHEGHLSLVKKSKKECSKTVVSIFVNPAQFAPDEDFSRYPRNMKRDLKLLRNLDVDIVFTPLAEKIYAPPSVTTVNVGKLTDIGEGEIRTSHFQGVTIIMTKLLNIAAPDVVYLGQKDIQQAVILKTMIKDLNIPTKVRICPTVREKDGLAMSSRNLYLSAENREPALSLIGALRKAREVVDSGITDCGKVINEMKKEFKRYSEVKPEYIICVDNINFSHVKEIIPNTIIAAAVKVGATRLIDNIIVSPK